MRETIGLVEPVTLKGLDGRNLTTYGRVDTGATKSSLDARLARDLKLGPVLRSKLVKSASGAKVRPVIKVTVIIKGREITAQFTIADRQDMKYKVLIGQNILKDHFLIDPKK